MEVILINEERKKRKENTINIFHYINYIIKNIILIENYIIIIITLKMD